MIFPAKEKKSEFEITRDDVEGTVSKNPNAQATYPQCHLVLPLLLRSFLSLSEIQSQVSLQF